MSGLEQVAWIVLGVLVILGAGEMARRRRRNRIRGTLPPRGRPTPPPRPTEPPTPDRLAEMFAELQADRDAGRVDHANYRLRKRAIHDGLVAHGSEAHEAWVRWTSESGRARCYSLVDQLPESALPEAAETLAELAEHYEAIRKAQERAGKPVLVAKVGFKDATPFDEREELAEEMGECLAGVLREVAAGHGHVVDFKASIVAWRCDACGAETADPKADGWTTREDGADLCAECSP